MFGEDIVDRARFVASEDANEVSKVNELNESNGVRPTPNSLLSLSLNQEPIELPASPVIWPAVLRMQEEETQEKMRIVRAWGVDFVMGTPERKMVGDGNKEKVKSPLAKKMGRVWGKVFGHKK